MARKALKLASFVSGVGATAALYMHSNKHLDPNDFGVVRIGRAVATTAVITFDYLTSLRNFPRGTEEYDYVKSQFTTSSLEALNPSFMNDFAINGLNQMPPFVVVRRQQVWTAEESEDSDEGRGPLGNGLLPSEIVGAGSSDEEVPEEPVSSARARRIAHRKEQLQ